MVQDITDHDSDEALMLAYKAGNFSAFELLYQRYDRQIYGLLMRKTGFKTADVEEIAQETWLALSRYSQNYQVTASFRTYFYTIVHNKFNDFYRRQQRQHQSSHLNFDEYQQELQHNMLADHEGCNDHANPEHAVFYQEKQQLLEKALKALASHHREIIFHRYQSELTMPEIALHMQIPLERAKSKLRYAKKALQELLIKYELSA